MEEQNLDDYEYDIISIIAKNAKFRKYLFPTPEPHHFYVSTDYKISTSCKHLSRIMSYRYMGKNELIGLNARLVFEKETDLKKAFRLLRKTGDSYIEEIVLKRKDNSVFWVLMCFRLENHFLFQEPQMLCQFININKEKSNTPIGKSNKDGLKAKLKKVIVNNKFQECIDELSKLFNDRDEKEILNTILAQESQLNLINRQQRLFTITNDEYNLTHSKIRKNLLDIIDEI